MKIMANLMTIILLITTSLTLISTITSKSMMTTREKMSPFECDLDPNSSAQIPFSLNFFLIAVIFLMFDVEITLLLPFIMMMETMSMNDLSMLMMTVISVIMLGTYHEWKQGILNWMF